MRQKSRTVKGSEPLGRKISLLIDWAAPNPSQVDLWGVANVMAATNPYAGTSVAYSYAYRAVILAPLVYDAVRGVYPRDQDAPSDFDARRDGPYFEFLQRQQISAAAVGGARRYALFHFVPTVLERFARARGNERIDIIALTAAVYGAGGLDSPAPSAVEAAIATVMPRILATEARDILGRSPQEVGALPLRGRLDRMYGGRKRGVMAGADAGDLFVTAVRNEECDTSLSFDPA